MILQALARYYDDLLQQGKISAPGWTKVKISYALDIGLDGQLKQVIPTRQDETKENRAASAGDGPARTD